MLCQEEGEGILLWILEGYRRFLENGKKFTASKRIIKAQDEYRNSYQLPDMFVKEAIKFSSDKKVFTAELIKHLKDYCEYKNIEYRQEYLDVVRRILRSRGVVNKKVRKKIKPNKGFMVSSLRTMKMNGSLIFSSKKVEQRNIVPLFHYNSVV